MTIMHEQAVPWQWCCWGKLSNTAVQERGVIVCSGGLWVTMSSSCPWAVWNDTTCVCKIAPGEMQWNTAVTGKASADHSLAAVSAQTCISNESPARRSETSNIFFQWRKRNSLDSLGFLLSINQHVSPLCALLMSQESQGKNCNQERGSRIGWPATKTIL